jgi:hypothetical protein
VVTAIDLNELANAGSTATWLVNSLSLGARNPELRIDHPTTKRLRRNLQLMQRSEFLRGQGGAKIVIA